MRNIQNMKKSFTLLITIFLLSIFSYLTIFILETKSLRNTNLQNQYLYIQAKNHKEFLKSYINSIELQDISDLKVEDEVFDIYAQIEVLSNSTYAINLYVKAKEFDISIHEEFTK